MKSLIAGPTDRTKVLRFGSLNHDNYNSHLEQIATTMLNHVGTINIIPDEGVPLDFAKHFRSIGGEVIGYISQGDCFSLQEYFKYCNRIVRLDVGWSGLNTCLSLEGDIITALGMSPGTMVEVAYTKYHDKYLNKKIPILIDRQSLRNKLPEEISEDLSIYYFTTNSELDSILKMIRGQLK